MKGTFCAEPRSDIQRLQGTAKTVLNEPLCIPITHVVVSFYSSFVLNYTFKGIIAISYLIFF